MTHPAARGRFRPRLWPTLATLLGLLILGSLGTWQTSRYFEKSRSELQLDANIDQTPLIIASLEELEQNAAPFLPVEIRGKLDPDYTFLFKHRVHDGKPGYWLGGILRFESGQGAIPVNRGWLPRERAHQLAERPVDQTTQTFHGILYQPERIIEDAETRQKLSQNEDPLRVTSDAPPVEWETYDITGVQNSLPFPTTNNPTMLVLDPSHSGRPYPIASLDYITKPYLTAEQHGSYAVFWFTTGLALLAMYLAAAFGYLGSGQHRPAPPDPKNTAS